MFYLDFKSVIKRGTAGMAELSFFNFEYFCCGFHKPQRMKTITVSYNEQIIRSIFHSSMGMILWIP